MKWFNKLKHNVSTCLCTRCGKAKQEQAYEQAVTDLLFNADAAQTNPMVRDMRREALVQWQPTV